ncbi:T9SS type A sorting domain-containing protein [Chryseobacterium arthrosphaerae]|uniref:T9SS type A sorting domain-containing protein n=1 Tax=Chryseobacterium arthrosphaerae TaxID=651561 RepID=UPI001BB0556E|nr:T9SS type A sorting domain-containing protein [Chryseobacterium arthrosphaerae]QUY56735.1 T9SS type A sorting domain-containing protein [Chryseobacterium arthrosphaerae]
MKKTFLFFFMAFLMSWSQLKAQSDYIIMLDNGSSTDEFAYMQMRLGGIKLIEQLLACNPENRVAVVQYGAGIQGNNTGIYKPLIYIESDFTKDHFTAQNFERRLNFGDFFDESLGLVDDALNGTPNTDIVSAQKTLDVTQPLNVIVLTDAERSTGGINIINSSFITNSDPNASSEFFNMLKFKNERDAKFTVVHLNTKPVDIQAAAAVASRNLAGPYTGPAEWVSGNDNNGPRMYYNRTNGFGLYDFESEYWRDMAEKICQPIKGQPTFNFLYEPGACGPDFASFNGEYNLPSGTILIDLKVDVVSLSTGQVYSIPANPVSIGSGSFAYYLQAADLAVLKYAGATGWHKIRLTLNYDNNGEIGSVYSWNNYPYFEYDINMDCSRSGTGIASEKEKIFKLTPNPTNGQFSIVLTKEVASGKVEVRDLTGNLVYHKQLRNEKQVDVNLSSRKEGIYIVNVITDKNETFSEKIIKK